MIWFRVRRWLHRRGVHRLCHVRQEAIPGSNFSEFLVGLDGHEYDITNQDGGLRYRTVHG